jgi:hypothetical protein
VVAVRDGAGRYPSEGPDGKAQGNSHGFGWSHEGWIPRQKGTAVS